MCNYLIRKFRRKFTIRRMCSDESFWGLKLEADRRYTTLVEKAFNLSKAELDCNSIEVDEFVSVLLENGNLAFIICNLNPIMAEVAELDLNFFQGDRVSVYLLGNGIVYLSGKLLTEEQVEAELNNQSTNAVEETLPEVNETSISSSGEEVIKSSSTSEEDKSNDKEKTKSNLSSTRRHRTSLRIKRINEQRTKSTRSERQRTRLTSKLEKHSAPPPSNESNNEIKTEKTTDTNNSVVGKPEFELSDDATQSGKEAVEDTSQSSESDSSSSSDDSTSESDTDSDSSKSSEEDSNSRQTDDTSNSDTSHNQQATTSKRAHIKSKRINNSEGSDNNGPTHRPRRFRQSNIRNATRDPTTGDADMQVSSEDTNKSDDNINNTTPSKTIITRRTNRKTASNHRKSSSDGSMSELEKRITSDSVKRVRKVVLRPRTRKIKANYSEDNDEESELESELDARRDTVDRRRIRRRATGIELKYSESDDSVGVRNLKVNLEIKVENSNPAKDASEDGGDKGAKMKRNSRRFNNNTRVKPTVRMESNSSNSEDDLSDKSAFKGIGKIEFRKKNIRESKQSKITTKSSMQVDSSGESTGSSSEAISQGMKNDKFKRIGTPENVNIKRRETISSQSSTAGKLFSKTNSDINPSASRIYIPSNPKQLNLPAKNTVGKGLKRKLPFRGPTLKAGLTKMKR